MSITHKDIGRLERKRVWEIDALRGFFILCLLAYHLYHVVRLLCVSGNYNIDPVAYVNATDPLHFWFRLAADGSFVPGVVPEFIIKYIQPTVVDIFFIISGISYKFSRNNLRGGLRLLLGAAFISGFTKLLVLYTGDENQFIRFGALHCYAACHLIHYYFLEQRSNQTLLLAAAVSLILGYYLKHNPMYSNSALLTPFGIYEYGIYMRDYWPVFPMLGWFLIGIVLGRKYYSEKVSLFPKQEDQNWHKPLCFLGRHSGLIYCGHMVVYSLVFIGIGHIFALY